MALYTCSTLTVTITPTGAPASVSNESFARDLFFNNSADLIGALRTFGDSAALNVSFAFKDWVGVPNTADPISIRARCKIGTSGTAPDRSGLVRLSAALSVTNLNTGLVWNSTTGNLDGAVERNFVLSQKRIPDPSGDPGEFIFVAIPSSSLSGAAASSVVTLLVTINVPTQAGTAVISNFNLVEVWLQDALASPAGDVVTVFL